MPTPTPDLWDPTMRHGMLKVAAATAVFGLVHSALASRPAKRAATRTLGERHAIGPFAWSRHPLNFAPLPILWLWPRMTTSLLAFNTAATIYLVVGSLHEEARLREAFGDDYVAYLDSGVPFYVPLPARSGLEP